MVAPSGLQRQAHELFGENYFAVVNAAHVADALLHGPVAREVGAHVDQNQLLHAGRLGHSSRAGGAALTAGLAVRVHHRLVVPAHAKHHVCAAGQFGHRVAGLSIAGEDDASLGGVHPVGEGIKPGLDMLGGSGGNLPVGPAEHLSRSHVLSRHRRRGPGQGAAPVHEDLLAQGVVDPGFPVVGEQAVFAKDTLGYLLSEVRAENLEPVLLPDALVPAAKEKAGVINVVVKVVVGKEEVIHLGREQPGLDQLMGGSGPAVKHQQLVAQFQHVGTSESGRGRRGSAGAQGVDFGHGIPPLDRDCVGGVQDSTQRSSLGDLKLPKFSNCFLALSVVTRVTSRLRCHTFGGRVTRQWNRPRSMSWIQTFDIKCTITASVSS